MPLVDEEALDALASFAEDGMVTPTAVYRSSSDVDPDTGQIGSNELGDDVEVVVENVAPESLPEPVPQPHDPLLGWFHSELQQQATEDDGQVATVDVHELRLPRDADIKAGDEVRNLTTGEFYQVIDVNDGDTYRVQTRASLRRRQG